MVLTFFRMSILVGEPSQPKKGEKGHPAGRPLMLPSLTCWCDRCRREWDWLEVRVPTFFFFVVLSRGTLATKKGVRRALLGDLVLMPSLTCGRGTVDGCAIRDRTTLKPWLFTAVSSFQGFLGDAKWISAVRRRDSVLKETIGDGL